jgi:excinuclease ABC subunit A
MHNPASYLRITQTLRKRFAESGEAQARGLNAQTIAPRCSACRGAGVLTLEMTFLPAVHAPCDACGGSGFADEAWAIRIRDHCLPELLDMTIDEVFTLWGQEEELRRPLQAARDVGLGYLALRQPGYALSGGEAQRLKIAAELLRPASTPTLYILDEPTVGQHLADVARLIGVLHRLVDQGHTVMVVEHHPMLLASCDHIIELGPEGGPGGGRIIAAGTPEQVARGTTPTAPYLKESLEGRL